MTVSLWPNFYIPVKRWPMPVTRALPILKPDPYGPMESEPVLVLRVSQLWTWSIATLRTWGKDDDEGEWDPLRWVRDGPDAYDLDDVVAWQPLPPVPEELP